MEKILHLTLKKVWFDMFASGIKKEEYREVKQYWIDRLMWHEYHFGNKNIQALQDYINAASDVFKRNYDAIQFRNGYNPTSPTLLYEFKEIDFGIGKPEWGAPKEPVFIIRPGKEISRNF